MKHKPKPVRGAATALAESRQASHEALVAELMAKRATADAAMAIEAASQCAYDIAGLEYRRNLAISRVRWCSLGCYGVAVGAAIGGAFLEPLLVVSLVVACMGATLHITSVALEA